MKKIMVIAPHPDDEIIGCGGTLLKHVSDGDKVYVIYLTNGEFCLNQKKYKDDCEVRKSEAYRVCSKADFEILYYPEYPSRSILPKYDDLLSVLVNFMCKIEPNIIYFPHTGERDNDHNLTNRIVKDACVIYLNNKETKVYFKLLCYEVWTPIQNMVKLVNISEYSDKKRELVKMYESQSSIDYSTAILSLNKYRASINGINGFAEGYSYETI